jgi:hypothetical protein
MKHCLNRISNAAYAQAWDRWVVVHAAMERAGRVIQRTLARLAFGQLARGWDRWLAVQAESMRAAAVVEKCMARMENSVVAISLDKWVAVAEWSKQENMRLHAATSILQAAVRRRHAQTLISDLRSMMAAAAVAPSFDQTLQTEAPSGGRDLFDFLNEVHDQVNEGEQQEQEQQEGGGLFDFLSEVHNQVKQGEGHSSPPKQ